MISAQRFAVFGFVAIASVASVSLWYSLNRPDYRFAPRQWETSLQSDTVAHWLGGNLESALQLPMVSMVASVTLEESLDSIPVPVN